MRASECHRVLVMFSHICQRGSASWGTVVLHRQFSAIVARKRVLTVLVRQHFRVVRVLPIPRRLLRAGEL